jgi:L-malate glycosyltransferase
VKILLVIPSLPMGGGGRFFVRLAQALAKKNLVVIWILSLTAHDQSLLRQLRDIRVFYSPFSEGFLFRALYKLSITVQALFPRLNIVDFIRNLSLRRLRRRYEFDVCNAHFLLAERQACLAFKHHDIAVVGTDHGDYRWAINDANRGYFSPIFQRADALICPSRSNLDICRAYPRPRGFQYFCIYHGYEPRRELTCDHAPTANEQARPFIFGMAGRGVAEKGWDQAVAAFTALRRQIETPVQLMLVGAGDRLSEIENALKGDAAGDIIFVGYQPHPEEFMAQFDVALFPSHYGPESLPMVVIECLSLGKPVIATDIGGVGEMLQSDRGPAGIIVQKDNSGRADTEELCAAMRRMIEDKPFFSECRQRAKLAFEKFDMDRCIESYIAAFASATAARKAYRS